MNSQLRVTLVQTDLAWQDPQLNCRNLTGRLRGLKGTTDLIVLPEMFSTGFSMESALLAEEMDGPTVGWMRATAQMLDCVLMGSLIIREAGNYFNRMLWVRPDGSLESYDKRHLFRMAGEHQHFSAGRERLSIEIKGWRVCPLICYDLRFPVWSRNRADYDVLIYIASWPASRQNVWSTLLRARAIENGAYVAGVNRVGSDGLGITYTGGSVAVDYLGQALCREQDGEYIETVVLERAALERIRASFPSHLDADSFELTGLGQA